MKMNMITYIEFALMGAIALEFVVAFMTAATRPDIADLVLVLVTGTFSILMLVSIVGLAYNPQEDSDEQDTEDSTQGTHIH